MAKIVVVAELPKYQQFFSVFLNMFLILAFGFKPVMEVHN